MIVNPSTGRLFLKVIHTSVWAGLKRLNQLSRWKCAEEVVALIQSLPLEEHPNQIVASRKSLLDPLEMSCVDFPNITLVSSGMKLPFATILRIEGMENVVMEATEPKMYVYQLYDDWLKVVSSFTAFSRLLLILRAYEADIEDAKDILFGRGGTVAPTHLWPSFSIDEWIEVEVALKDVILRHYGQKHGVNVASLTASEIRDIILGQSIHAPSEARQKLAEIDAPYRLGVGVERKVVVRNALGQAVETSTMAPYEAQTFQSKSDWRVRAVAASAIPLRAQKVLIASGVEAQSGKTTYVMCKNLLRKFLGAADRRSQIGGILYGCSPGDEPMIKEIRALVVPPQWGNSYMIHMPSAVPHHSALEGLEPIGFIHTHTMDEEVEMMPPADAILSAKLMASNPSWEGRPIVDMILSFTEGSMTLAAYQLRDAGYRWGSENQTNVGPVYRGYDATFSETVHVILSDRFRGFSLVPEYGNWNFNFRGVKPAEGETYRVELGNPKEFYHESFRPDHILSWVSNEPSNKM